MSKKNTNHKPTIVYRKKPRYQYVPVRETLTSDELGTYATYSMSVRTVEEEIAFVSDITTDYEEIERLADLCTAKELDPLHLEDVVQDFLADPEAELALT